MSLHDKITDGEAPGWQVPSADWEPIGVTVAYKELTCRAFSVWIRLHTFVPGQLKLGRVRLSRTLGISEPTFNRVARELVSKGYLAIESRAYKNRSTVRLARRARTGGFNSFINV